MAKLESINPATNEILGSVETSSTQEIKEKVKLARDAQALWYKIGIDERIKKLSNLRDLLNKHADIFAEKTSIEMGMPISFCKTYNKQRMEKFDWNLENAKQILSPKLICENDSEINEILFEPFGVMACIMAWNWPLPNFIFSATQALLVGNTVVIKYSEEIPLFTKYFEEIVKESDIPKGVIEFIYGDGKAGKILTDQDIDFISFTGSYATGKHLYKKAADKFIPIIMELGGSSPGIVFNDVNLDEAIPNIFWSRFRNTGQFCSNLKRLIVHESIFDEVIKKLAEFASKRIIGNPMDEKTEIGPLVAERQIIQLESQLKDAVDKGAKIICGGKRPDNLKGAFFEPTILTNITSDMLVWKEEVFGPILPVVSFKTYEEAIELANDTIYGLNAFIYTYDKEIESKAIKDIKAGSVTNIGASAKPATPFGGYKCSGMGKEGGELGFLDVCQKKVVARKK